MRFKTINQIKQRSFKKRYRVGVQAKRFRYGNTLLFLSNSMRVEFAHYNILRYYLKRLIKPKNVKYNNKKC